MTLSDIFKQTEVMDFEDIKSIIFPILEGLKLLHKKNILHLSINPDHILIRTDGVPGLTGLGSFYSNFDAKIDMREIINFEYAPVEQLTKQEKLIGPWSDIYSLGAVLYRCISGSPPPQSLERHKSIKQIGEDIKFKIIDKGDGKYPLPTLRAIDHALEIRPANRPKTVSEWTQEFLELTDKEVSQPMGITPDLDETLRIEVNKVDETDDTTNSQDNRRKLFAAFLGGKPNILDVFIFATRT